MKKRTLLLLLSALFAGILTSCSKDEGVAGSEGKGNVAFRIRTRTTPATAPRGPVYAADGFRILAFRKQGTDYRYDREIPVGGMRYDGSVLSGTVQLPEGEYTFIPTYGFSTSGNYTWPDCTLAPLSEALYVTHTAESFPEVFMLNRPLDAVERYSVVLDGERQSVRAALGRSVSRVDVLFIRARKHVDGTYEELSGENIFGPEGLATARIAFTGANAKMGMTGLKIDGTFDATHHIPSPEVVMGTGTATVVGDPDYMAYDEVDGAQIIAGSAHMKGTYLIPNADPTPTAGVELVLTSGQGTVRTIRPKAPIPVERNKVTIIKVWVLGDNVFTTGVDFAVDIDTVWDGSNPVETEID